MQTGIQPTDFDKAMQRFEFSFTAPFHNGVPRIINRIGFAAAEKGADHSREHGFVHFHSADLLDILRQIKAGRFGYCAENFPVLQVGKQIRLRLNTCAYKHCRSLCNPVISFPMCCISRKTVAPKCIHVIPIRIRMNPVQYGKRTLIQANGFAVCFSGNGEQPRFHRQISLG